MRNLVLSAALTLVLLGAIIAPCADAAQGVILGPEQLPAEVREELVAAVDSARTAMPAAFSQLADLRRELPRLDARKRGPVPALTRILKAMGNSALFPMLERIALDSSPREGLSEAAWIAWRTALLDAVGMLRDERATPVLWAVVASEFSDERILRAAASAVAKLGDDTTAATLVEMSRETGPKHITILAAMGHCRREVVARRLAEALIAQPEPTTALLIARSLGNIGSLWAWQTPSVRVYETEQESTRRTAAQALVEAYLAYDGEVRSMIAKALLVVAHPSTPLLIEAQRVETGPPGLRALDDLAARFAASPIH